jgi:hypothetical protein
MDRVILRKPGAELAVALEGRATSLPLVDQRVSSYKIHVSSFFDDPFSHT